MMQIELQTTNYHIQLNQFFLNKENPELILKFIYENVFQLIEEIPFIIDNLGQELRQNYKSYYSEIIRISNKENNYLLTLFPNPELSKYFSFKKMYIGITGRLLGFSNIHVTEHLHLYGDPRAWDVSYNLILEKKQNNYKFTKGIFGLFNNYTENQIKDMVYMEDRPDYFFIVCKEDLINKNQFQYIYEVYAFNELLKNYKINIKKYFKKKTFLFLEKIFLQQYKRSFSFNFISHKIEDKLKNNKNEDTDN